MFQWLSSTIHIVLHVFSDRAARTSYSKQFNSAVVGKEQSVLAKGSGSSWERRKNTSTCSLQVMGALSLCPRFTPASTSSLQGVVLWTVLEGTGGCRVASIYVCRRCQRWRDDAQSSNCRLPCRSYNEVAWNSPCPMEDQRSTVLQELQ